MATVDGDHVFISYVREDKSSVDRLAEALSKAAIPYWLDRESISPGVEWRRAIKEAINDQSLVFVACFSKASVARDRSGMNEELALAAEEFRRLPPGRVWLLPVRLDDVDLPDWDLGAGRTLNSLQRVDLFGESYAANLVQLGVTILRLMGDTRGAASVMNAVAHATGTERTTTVRDLVKSMIPDPARAIDLARLIRQESDRARDVLSDPTRYAPGTQPKAPQAVAKEVVVIGKAYWEASEPFINSLQLGARYGEQIDLTEWKTGLRSLTRASSKFEGGSKVLADLRWLPVVGALMTVAVTAAASDRWEVFRELLVDNAMPTERGDRRTLVEISHLYLPFSDVNEPGKSVVARAWIEDRDAEAVWAEATGGGGRRGLYKDAQAELLHHLVREVVQDEIRDDDDYDEAFDTAEVLLGMVATDAALSRTPADDGFDHLRTKTKWFGRATWHAPKILRYLTEEIARTGPKWPPLRAGLFGGDEKRAALALEEYEATFDSISNQRSF